MEQKSTQPYIAAFEVGAIAGMRAMSALAWTAHKKHSRAEIPLEGLALFEIVIDKLPSTPSRIAPFGLIARVGAAAISAGLVAQRNAKNSQRALLALMGSTSAIASAYLMHFVRKKICQRTGIKDAFLGAGEDALMFALGRRVFRSEA